MLFVTILSVSCIAFISFIYPSQPKDKVPYPEGYRQWTHIKTAIVGPKHPDFRSSGGFHHIYANEKAMEGYLSGKFAEGSVIIFDVLEALVQGNSNTDEGKRKYIDVMIKDSTKYSTTGGWGYEEYNGDSKTERNTTLPIQVQCYNCHVTQKNHVFSTYRK